MKILALVASQDSTVEDVKTNGRRQMQALIGKDKEVLFCEYSTIEICRNGGTCDHLSGRKKWKSRIISGHYLDPRMDLFWRICFRMREFHLF